MVSLSYERLLFMEDEQYIISMILAKILAIFLQSIKMLARIRKEPQGFDKNFTHISDNLVAGS